MPGSSEFNAMDSGMRRNDGLIRGSLSAFAGTVNADTSADYFVLQPGNRIMWSVTENSGTTDQASAVAVDTTLFNGVETISPEFSDGSKFYFSVDEQGFKRHRL
jgi:hypothetical protein